LSEQKDLEKLQAKRSELEAESRSLKEEQKKLEYSIKILEEQVVIEELCEKNKTAKDAISNLEAKLTELESRMKPKPQSPPACPAPPPPAETNHEMITPPSEEMEQAPEPEPEVAEAAPEDPEESGVTVTAIDDEALVETQEAKGDKQQDKKKHRFF